MPGRGEALGEEGTAAGIGGVDWRVAKWGLDIGSSMPRDLLEIVDFWHRSFLNEVNGYAVKSVVMQ